MKKKDTILILGVIAIVIMLCAQTIIISGLWKQQDEMLSLRYRSLSQEAVNSLRGTRSTVYDTVRFFLDYYSAPAVRDLSTGEDTSLIRKKKQEITEYFTFILNKEQDFSDYLSGYFESLGYEKEFNHRIEITSLALINGDTIHISGDRSYRNARPVPGLVVAGPGSGQGRPQYMASTNVSKSSILVQRQRWEDNSYIMFFDYFIDFSDKRKMILRELSASIGMSLFSIVVVLVIFLVTYRNLAEEKRLSNLKTDFINNMTHELKTPLATITVAGKTLEMEKIRSDDSKILETAKLIGKQSVHLNQLINMILEISMWERTEFQLDKKKVDIAEVMNDIVGSFKSGLGTSAELTQKYNLDGIKADVDVVYFTTLINNLLSNAVKYSDKQPVIKVEGTADEKNITISIADNGIGISKTDQKHVFDKFYRASTGNIHKFKGLGLGLYYVKKIATAHGGDVSVTSKSGKGSIFTVTIPY